MSERQSSKRTRRHLGIQRKLSLSLALLVLVVGGAGIHAAFELRRLGDFEARAAGAIEAAAAATRVSQRATALRAAWLGARLGGDDSALRRATAALQGELDAQRGAIEGRAGELGRQDLARQLLTAADAEVQLARTAEMRAHRAPRGAATDAAAAPGTELAQMEALLATHEVAVAVAAEQLATVLLAEHRTQWAASREHLSTLLRNSVLLVLLGVAVTSVLVLRQTESLRRSIVQAAGAARRLAAGDLTVDVAAGGADEAGQLLVATRRMVEKLRHLVAEVQSTAEAITGAASQVSTTAQSLSRATTQQAASVEETTSSLEEMNASISQNAEASRKMEAMAVSGATDAEESGKAVSETVVAMRAIATRTAIIEEIAYQTNLLALNAAIEAARAGEHGHGFAVVASEVRKLAERSQVAANEINHLSRTSVGVAERSGNLLAALVPSIRETVDMVQDVAAASNEQAAGVSQMNQALSQVDQATQANSVSADLLATTAEQMVGQVTALRSLVDFFQTNRSASAASPSRAPAASRSGALPPRGPAAPSGGARAAAPDRPVIAPAGGNGPVAGSSAAAAPGSVSRSDPHQGAGPRPLPPHSLKESENYRRF